MYGKNFVKSVLWNGIFSKIPGHPRKQFLGRLRSYIGQSMVTSATSTSVFSQHLNLRGFDIRIGHNSGLGTDCVVMTGGSYLEIGNRVFLES